MKPVKWNCRLWDTFKDFIPNCAKKTTIPNCSYCPPRSLKCVSVTGRYVSQSHPGLNSIKESTKTYGSGARDMIRLLCTTTLLLWFIPSFIWSLTVMGWNNWAKEGSLRWAAVSSRGYKKACWTHLWQSTGHIVIIVAMETRRSDKTSTKSVFSKQGFSVDQHSDILRLRGSRESSKPKAMLLSSFSIRTMQRSNCTPALPPHLRAELP